MSRPTPTPSKVVREVLVNYSREHKRRRHSRKRRDDRDQRVHPDKPSTAVEPEFIPPQASPSLDQPTADFSSDYYSPEEPIPTSISPLASDKDSDIEEPRRVLESYDFAEHYDHKDHHDTGRHHEDTAADHHDDPDHNEDTVMHADEDHPDQTAEHAGSPKKKRKKRKGVFSKVKQWLILEATILTKGHTQNDLQDITPPQPATGEVEHKSEGGPEAQAPMNVQTIDRDVIISAGGPGPVDTKVTKRAAAGDENKNMDLAVDLEVAENVSMRKTFIDDLSVEESVPEQECCFFSTLPQHYVSPELRNGSESAQTRFLQKVFCILALKAALVITWLFLVRVVDEIKDFYSMEGPVHYHFVSAGVYASLKVLLRVSPSIKQRACIIQIIFFILEIVVACDFLAYVVEHWLEEFYVHIIYIISAHAGMCFFFIFAGTFAQFEVRDGIMMGAAVIVTALVSVSQLMGKSAMGWSSLNSHNDGYTEELVGRITVLAVSELLTMIVMFELKSLLTGYRFSPVLTSDWFFTALYII